MSWVQHIVGKRDKSSVYAVLPRCTRCGEMLGRDVQPAYWPNEGQFYYAKQGPMSEWYYQQREPATWTPCEKRSEAARRGLVGVRIAAAEYGSVFISVEQARQMADDLILAANIAQTAAAACPSVMPKTCQTQSTYPKEPVE